MQYYPLDVDHLLLIALFSDDSAPNFALLKVLDHLLYVGVHDDVPLDHGSVFVILVLAGVQNGVGHFLDGHLWYLPLLFALDSWLMT